MKPVVLLIGKLPGIVGHLADELEDLPIRWLGAHDHGEVVRQLDTEPIDILRRSWARAFPTTFAATSSV